MGMPEELLGGSDSGRMKELVGELKNPLLSVTFWRFTNSDPHFLQTTSDTSPGAQTSPSPPHSAHHHRSLVVRLRRRPVYGRRLEPVREPGCSCGRTSSTVPAPGGSSTWAGRRSARRASALCETAAAAAHSTHSAAHHHAEGRSFRRRRHHSHLTDLRKYGCENYET